MADIARFPVYVDEEAFAEDREHASAAGREMADRERARFEREGIAPGELRACEPRSAWSGSDQMSGTGALPPGRSENGLRPGSRS